MLAMPTTTVANTIGAMSIRISLMNASTQRLQPLAELRREMSQAAHRQPSPPSRGPTAACTRAARLLA